MTFLKRLKSDFSVKELLHREVGGYEENRDAHVVHASDLTREQFCPREVVLMRRLDMQKYKQRVTLAQRLTFDEGHDKQWRVNNDYLRAHMVGRWKCSRCDVKTREFTLGPPRTHGSDCHHRWEYVEPTVRRGNEIVGSLDGLVQFLPKKIRMLEVKILNVDDFKKLKAPLAEHRVRTLLYLKLIDEDPDFPVAVDTSIAHVLYLLRGFGIKDAEHGFSPLKEYPVKRNDALIERYERMAVAIAQAQNNPRQTPIGICATLHDERTKTCRVAKQCFSGRYPGNLNY